MSWTMAIRMAMLTLAVPSMMPAAPAQTVSAPYLMGTGDRLRVVIYGEEKLSGEFAVNGEGVVPFPLVGDVPARGRPVADFRADLIARLGREFLRSPSVTVEIIGYRPVFILGEVMRPGSFPYAEGMTVYGLVAMAGGFTYRAKTRQMVVRREGGADEVRLPIDSATDVRPGDTIRIPERFF